jgi:hypothetical protein
MLACREKSKSSKRGGDPLARQRRQRDEAISALARLSGIGKPIEQQGNYIFDKGKHHR